jgi:hypothetical protein
MKTSLRLVSPTACLLPAALLTGCVGMAKISYDDAPRSPVQFASPQAERIFYDAILAQRFPTDGPHHQVSLNLTPPIWYHHWTVKSANVIFNQAAAAADTNHDGIITEDEALAFAKKQEAKLPPPQPSAKVASADPSGATMR